MADLVFHIDRRKLIHTGLAGLACCALPLTAHAHRKKRAVSTVEWNTSSKLLQVTHELHLHDAEQGLNRLGKITKPDLSSLRARAQLALYVQEHFAVFKPNGNPIDLEIIGAEIGASYAYIYQEIKLASVPNGLKIRNSILQDMYLDQTNLVNIIFENELSSLVFVAGDEVKNTQKIK